MPIITLFGLQSASSESAAKGQPRIGMASAQPAPAIGNNNDQEPPATAKELLSAVFKCELGLYLLNLNTPIDLTAIYSSRLKSAHPDEA